MLQTLRKIPIFQELCESQFMCLLKGFNIWLNPGDFLFKQGETAKCFYVVLEGAIRLTRQISNQEVVLATYTANTFFGEVPLLAGTLHLASGQAVSRTHVYCLHEDEFWQMLMVCPSVRKAILGFMASRMQELQMLSQQHEKLISLGTLAAGFAHELGNPTAAARQAARNLHNTVKVLQNLALETIEQHLTTYQLECLLELKSKAIEQIAKPNNFDPLAQIDLDEELTDWLESHGVVNGWKLASTLVAAGLNTQHLEIIAQQVTASTFIKVLTWLEATLGLTSSLNVLEQGVTRISDLVNAIKAYSYMDESPLKEIVVHEGIENTLTMLGYEIRKHRIQVIREYEQNLPLIQAYGGALNQVWTNLIDNAIDALDEEGTIWVRTFSEKDYIVVEIADNGAGIPPQIQARIFDPFFTTKEIGVGTGLGLEITYRIVVSQHQGDIRCFSQPGDTRFQVRLPICPFKESNKSTTEVEQAQKVA